jgi:hypothetical protein
MKLDFAVLESRPRIAFSLDRDSVSAGDDCQSHKVSVETYSFVDPVALAEKLSSGYLPSVAGYGHSWECILNGTVIAKVCSNGKAEKIQEVDYGEENKVYFKYNSATY